MTCHFVAGGFGTVLASGLYDVFLSLRSLQVAIWRDTARRRLVIAFRGTEQVGRFITSGFVEAFWLY